MADQSSTISKNVQFKYRLILGNIISKETPGQLTLIQNDRVLMDDKENEKSYYATLCGVKVNKKIYQPTEIEAEIDFMMKTSDDSTGKETIKAPSFRAVSALFLQREVMVDFIEVPDTTFGDDSYTDCPTHTVSKKCYVYEVNPLLKRDVNGRKMCVKLNIFSMDKLMTLNKYSKAYVARKLGEQILKPESLTFGTKTDGTTPLVKTLTDLRFRFYEENNEKRVPCRFHR